MGLLIKDNNADFSNVQGSQKYYFDALTNKGTILLHDFSRQSCLPQHSLRNGSGVVDLAYGGTILNNNSTFKVTSSLNLDKDFLVDGALSMLNTSAVVDGEGGINLGNSILNYLKTNDVKKLLFIFWVYMPYEPSSRDSAYAFVKSTTADIGEGNSGNLLRVFINASNQFVVSIAGVATQGISTRVPNNKFGQVAVVYERGEVLKTYRNSVKVNSDSTQVNNNSWGTPNTNLNIGNNTNDGINSNVRLGRLLIENIETSGRDPEAVIVEDYQYVNGTGKYKGIQKRPYANI